jgi:membrane protein implicated in regulation of membrane protease activity
MSYFVWLILAVIAFVVEMTLPTFFALFAGIGFAVAAGVAYLYPDSLFAQLIVAALFMVIGAVVFKMRRIGESPEKGVGTHNEFAGIEGIAKTPLSAHKEGEVELYEAVVSSRNWFAVTTGENIEAGDEVRIVQVRGNTLVVEKITKGS